MLAKKLFNILVLSEVETHPPHFLTILGVDYV